MAISAEDKNFLVSLYVGYFNRAPDPAGLQFWIDQVEAGRDTNTIAADFAASPEAKSLYPFLTTPDVSSPTSFITAVYANLFNRAPDAAGQAFWEAQLSSGAVSPADAIDAIIKGATTAPDSTILTNKNTVGLDFATDAGNTPGFVYDTAAAAAAVSAISGVTEDAATVVTAQAATDAFLGGVANPGQTLDLTTGVDTITGTSGNDTINGAFKVVDGGADLATLGGLDTIDGGAGIDTLAIANQENAGVTIAAASVSNVENLNVRSADGAVVADVSNFAGMTNVAVESGTAGGSDVDIDTKANVTSVSVKGGQVDGLDTISIDDTNTTAGADKLASVTLDGVADATPGGDVVTIGSDALTSLTMKNSAVGATVTAAAGTRELGVTLDNMTAGTITDNTATTLNVTASGTKSDIDSITAGAATTAKIDAAVDLSTGLAGAAIKTVDINGAGKVTLENAQNGAALTAIDASDNSGGVIATVDTDVTFTGGTGKDTLTVGATSKANTLGAGDDTFNASVTAATGGSVDGGEGTDTVAMTSANAAALSAGTAFEADISNFEKVSLGATAEGATDTVNLANLDDISYVVTAGTAAGTAAGGTQESSVFTFADLKSGQSVVVNGLTLTANDDVTGTELAAAFVAEATTGNVGVSGAETVASTSTNAGATVTTVADAVGNVADLTVANAAAAAPTAPGVATGQQGNPGQTETGTVVFSTLLAGQSLTIDGITVTATGSAALGAEVAAAFISGNTSGAAVVSGADTGAFNGAAGANAETVVFTSTTANTDVTDLAVTAGGGATAPTPTIVQGEAQATETATVTWQGLLSGQSVTVAGRTVTALDDLTAAQVDAIFEGGVTTAQGQVSGTLTGWATAAGTATTTVFTSASVNTNVTDLSASVQNSTVPANPTPTITQGAATGPGGALVLSGLASGATVELTGANAGSTTVNLASTTGTADVVNLKLNGAANVAAGAINVAGVETIAIETTDSTADTPTVNNPTAPSTISLNAAATTSVTVAGNHGVDFTGSTLTNVTNLDASGVVAATAAGTAAANGTAGAVTFSTVVTDKSVTITTGNGDDVIDASTVGTTGSTDAVATITTGAGADVVTGGADEDVINTGTEADEVNSSASADNITLGAGNDVYDLNNTAHSVLAARDVITDFSANTVGQGTSGAVTSAGATNTVADRNGDIIDLDSLTGLGAIRVGVQSNAADAQTFIQNGTTDGTAAVNAALDSSTGLLYIDIDDNGSVDSVIELTGVTTIDAGAFLI